MQQLIQQFNYQKNEDKPFILISFQVPWDQDDIRDLITCVFNCIGKGQVIEHALGADLETVHFRLDNDDYLLNFEVYSQSCWLEVVNQEDSHALLQLYENNEI